MPLKQTTVDVSAAGKQAYDTTPNIVTDGFIPDFYMVRANSLNVAEAMISFDGVTDGLQIGLPTAAGLGQQWVKIKSHSTKIWVREVGVGGAACILLVAVGTNV